MASTLPPASRNSSRCGGLWHVSQRLHLWTLLTVRSWRLLGHFLDHYARHGVPLETNAHVVLHEDFAPATVVAAARQVLRVHGVRDVEVVPSVDARSLEPIKIRKLNMAIRRLAEGALLIFADGNAHAQTASNVRVCTRTSALLPPAPCRRRRVLHLSVQRSRPDGPGGAAFAEARPGHVLLHAGPSGCQLCAPR